MAVGKLLFGALPSPSGSVMVKVDYITSQMGHRLTQQLITPMADSVWMGPEASSVVWNRFSITICLTFNSSFKMKLNSPSLPLMSMFPSSLPCLWVVSFNHSFQVPGHRAPSPGPCSELRLYLEAPLIPVWSGCFTAPVKMRKRKREIL